MHLEFPAARSEHIIFFSPKNEPLPTSFGCSSVAMFVAKLVGCNVRRLLPCVPCFADTKQRRYAAAATKAWQADGQQSIFSELEGDLLFQMLLSRFRPLVVRCQKDDLCEKDKIWRSSALRSSPAAPAPDDTLPSLRWKEAFKSAVLQSSAEVLRVCQVCNMPLVNVEEGLPAAGHTTSNRHLVCTGFLDRLLVASVDLTDAFAAHDAKRGSELSRGTLRLWSDPSRRDPMSRAVNPPTVPGHLPEESRAAGASWDALRARSAYTAVCEAAMAPMTPKQRLAALPLEWGERLHVPRRSVETSASCSENRLFDDQELGSMPCRLRSLSMSWRGAVCAFRRVNPPDVRRSPGDRLMLDVFQDPRWPSFAAAFPSVALELDFRTARRHVVVLADAGLLPITFGLAAVHTPTSDGTIRGEMFERLECIGDHTFGSESSGRLRRMLSNEDCTHQANSQWFDEMRCACEGAHNMNVVARQLQLVSLLSRSPLSNGFPTVPTSTKYTTDLLECLLGELRMFCWATSPQTAHAGPTRFRSVAGGSSASFGRLETFVEDTLTLLLDVMALCLAHHGHQSRVDLLFSLDALFDDGVKRAVFSNRCASEILRRERSPFCTERADALGETSRRRYGAVGASLSHSACKLPPRLAVHASPTKLPSDAGLVGILRRGEAVVRDGMSYATSGEGLIGEPISEPLSLTPAR